MRQYLHYGCHTCAPDSWWNFDASPTLRIQRIPLLGALLTRRERDPDFPENVQYGDIVAGLPVPEASCKAAYCSHVLEHLSLRACRTALRNTYRYLEPEGVFRLVMPDLKGLSHAYLARKKEDSALHFMRRSHLGEEHRGRTFAAFLREWLGNSRHLWMWDFKSMKSELEGTGFRNIRRAAHGDADDPRFHDVEERRRWVQPGFDEDEEIRCLGIECRK